jgi:hypothetical protein
MRHAFRIARFLVFLFMSMALIWATNFVISRLILSIFRLDLHWIFLFLLCSPVLLGCATHIFTLIGKMLSNLNPDKKVVSKLTAPVLIITTILTILFGWSLRELQYTTVAIAVVISSLLTVFFAYAYYLIISPTNYDEVFPGRL